MFNIDSSLRTVLYAWRILFTCSVYRDIMMSVMAFVQKGPRAVCVLSGNGFISSVTLRAFDNSSDTVTLEGPYEIISLSGSFSPAPTGGKTKISGGLSVSFVQADGVVRGGGIAGMAKAATVVQIVLVTFVPADKYFQTPVKEEEKPSVTSTAPTTPAPAAPPADPNAAGPSSSTPTGSEIMKEKETDVLVVDD
ncbi:AT-hook motif nuclear-localized protein 1 [Linum grandiflorum]